MRDHPLMPALVVGALLAVGLIGSGAFVGQGLVNARIGDRSVTVRGLAERDVRADLATSRALNELVRQGVVLQDYAGPTYIFTRLNAVRPAMIAEATASARTGAEQFAKDSGAPLGPIRQANQGSFQILARDEVGDESTSPDKKVRVVTTISYRLR